MNRYEDKVAVVTGAGSGIGAATARRLSTEGASVVCLDIVEEAAEKTAAGVVESGGTAAAIAGSVFDEADAEAAICTALDEFGKLDLLANVAGVGGFSHTTELSLADWQRQIDVNLTGTFVMSKFAINPLIETRGAIVNVGSVSGLRGQAYSAAYCASKGGVVMLSKALAVEYATKGVRVNCVCPGGVETPLLAQFEPIENANPRLLERVMSPMKRMAKPAEVAAAIAYLGSEEAAYVSGDSLVVDGATLAI